MNSEADLLEGLESTHTLQSEKSLRETEAVKVVSSIYQSSAEASVLNLCAIPR